MINLRDVDQVIIDRVAIARAKVVSSETFFGHLLFSTEQSFAAVDTACTDGQSIWFDPAYVERTGGPELVSTYLHEVLHIALGHCERRGGRDPLDWNIACDHVVNLTLKDGGYVILPGDYCDEAYRGLSAEDIYLRLHQTKPSQPQGGQGQSSPDPADRMIPGFAPRTGQIIDPFNHGTGGKLSDRQVRELGARNEKELFQAANLAKSVGDLPDTFAEIIDGRRKNTNFDWEERLRRFVGGCIPFDQSFARPDRRFLPDDIWLPGNICEDFPEIAIGIDVSGSVSPAELQAFAAETNRIFEDFGFSKLHVIYCNKQVVQVDSFETGDTITFDAPIGGGTSFAPVFRWINENAPDVKAVIYFTDLKSHDYGKPDDYDVFWAIASHAWVDDYHGGGFAPFGEVCKIEVAA